MRCFYHPDQDAVGMCKNCGRGLCPQSLAEVENGLACKGRCEEQVRAINMVQDRSRRMVQRSHPVNIVLSALIGLLFAGVGLVTVFYGGPVGFFIMAVGAIIFASGAYAYLVLIRPRGS